MQATTENGSTSIAEVRKTWKAFSFVEPEFNVPAHESQKQTGPDSTGAATVVRIKDGQVSFAGGIFSVQILCPSTRPGFFRRSRYPVDKHSDAVIIQRPLKGGTNAERAGVICTRNYQVR
jgi:hypothetical protein